MRRSLWGAQVMNQAKILIVFSLGWVRDIFGCTQRPISHSSPFCTTLSPNSGRKWPRSVLIASVHRGIEPVSGTLPHIRTNLPLSNFIQARLVTAEERRVLRAQTLTSPPPVMRRRALRGIRASGGRAYSLAATGGKSICSAERWRLRGGSLNSLASWLRWNTW